MKNAYEYIFIYIVYRETEYTFKLISPYAPKQKTCYLPKAHERESLAQSLSTRYKHSNRNLPGGWRALRPPASHSTI